MSCNSESCSQSGCYKDTAALPPESNAVKNSLVCVKCKLNDSIAAASPQLPGAGGDITRFCSDCFRSNLYGKFRLAVSSNALISPSDNVLVAFSGGASSRVALQFVHEMQLKSQRNFDASVSRDRPLPVFGVGVVFVDERSSVHVPAIEFEKAVEEMEEIISKISPPAKRLHVVPTESLYSSSAEGRERLKEEGRDRLKELVYAVRDVTGREDVLHYLRMLALQKVALENGYTKIVLGTCTSRIACHVLEATVKGQGYSLAADIQYVDARWKTPVVLPLRDCLTQELNMLCNLDSLKTLETFKDQHSGINALIASFVKLLQEENPSRESTIVRTAGKLTPFHFNRMPEADDKNSQLASQRRQKKFNLKPNESLPLNSFCRICNSPLKLFDVNCNSKSGIQSNEVSRDECCPSCQLQILPEDTVTMGHFFSLLPPQMVAQGTFEDRSRAIREQIQDCILSDSEDGT